MVRRILSATGAGRHSRVLSLGCGIGDTEILLAPHVGEIVGLDPSPAAIRQAREDAARAGVGNVRFEQGALEAGAFSAAAFDLVMAVFLLHHLSGPKLVELLERARGVLAQGGLFYSIDPSRHRLSGAVGKVLFAKLMRRYRTPGERELDRRELEASFNGTGFRCSIGFYDFISSPLAGLLPG